MHRQHIETVRGFERAIEEKSETHIKTSDQL
jgi:hypothetical protein